MKPTLRICTLWLALLLSGLSQRALAQSVRYVTPTGAGTRDGSSWTNALSGTALQGALASAPSGTTILVAAGVYKPTSTTDRNITFSIPAGVEVYGGYTAGTTNRTTNPSSTTLSGDIDNDNTLAGNTYKVVTTGSGTVVIDGLVIIGGDARPLGGFIEAGGGGLFVGTGSLVVRAVQFIDNAAKDGGGIFINSSTSATITNCTFTGNTTTGGDGGGLYVNLTDTRSVIISSCRFVKNRAEDGGAVYNRRSSPSFTNCLFANNTASDGGGGMYNRGLGDVSSPSLTNCSFAGNTALSGGAMYSDGPLNGVSSPSLTNCIIWANSSGVFNDSANPKYSYTDLQDGVPAGTGNRSVDPLFVDAAGVNLQLSSCSPLIDAGDNTVSVGTTDLAGAPRRQRTIDLGAFEFQGMPSSPVTITRQPVSGSSVCAGTTVTAQVSATGTVTYRWYKGNQAVSGQTSATLTLPTTTTAQSGSYSVVVTGSCNSVTSTAFSLTVTPLSPDYQPLVDLYNSANGRSWTRKDNWLTGCSPCGWQGVTCDGSGRVIELSLSNNELDGTIPASLGDLTSLQGLFLGINRLNGNMPASLGNLTSLQRLNLSVNRLGGPIPASLGNLVSLQELSLDINQLSGSIPDSFSALTSLQGLFLQKNQLSGNIPTSLSALTSLQALFLYENQLSGPIPASLGNLTSLQQLNLSVNQLSGCFPVSLSTLCGGGRRVDFSNNPDLPGGGDFGAFCANGAGSNAFRPQATASPNPVCAGNAVNLSVSAGTSYQWRGPNSFTASTQNPSLTATTPATSGLYSVTVGSGSTTCSATATASVSVTVNALPTVSVTPSATAICAGQTATFAATPGLAAYRWSTPNSGAVLTTASISVSVAGTYSLTVTNASTCTATAQASLTVNPLPTPTIQGLPASICQEASPVLLTGTGNPSGGVFTIDGSPATTLNPASLSVGQHTVVYSYTNPSGCSNTASQMVTIKATPQPPTIATQSGHSYPAGVSNLTISQNTGNVILTASGCAGGTITWAGGNNTTLAVSTMNTGVQTFTATCQTNGCNSPIATATVTVVGTTLSVLHRDGNGQTNTNTLAPYLQLNNQGNTAIPYSEITVRYWLTVENYSPLLFNINYAQLGSDKVHLKYVPAATGNPGATGYIEFSFDAAAGSLGAMSNSGPIQDLINKQDYSYFNQADDYSYVNTGQYTPNPRITAYRNGTLFWGQEPGLVTPTRSLKASSQNNTAPDANTIEAVLSVTNDGSLPVNYSDLKVRYYFTADNNQPLVLSQVGYTALGSGNVSAQLVPISPALGGADTYLELSFAAGLGQLAPGVGTGGVTYQLRHGDYSGFNQANDYSYQGTGGMMLNSRVVVFVAGQRVWGTEPGATGRVAAESETPLRVRVLGNPIAGSTIEMEVRGAEGQPLQLHLSDQQGRAIGERSVETAGSVERQSLRVGGQPAGLLLLRVSTPTQSQTVKVLKAD